MMKLSRASFLIFSLEIKEASNEHTNVVLSLNRYTFGILKNLVQSRWRYHAKLDIFLSKVLKKRQMLFPVTHVWILVTNCTVNPCYYNNLKKWNSCLLLWFCKLFHYFLVSCLWHNVLSLKLTQIICSMNLYSHQQKWSLPMVYVFCLDSFQNQVGQQILECPRHTGVVWVLARKMVTPQMIHGHHPVTPSRENGSAPVMGCTVRQPCWRQLPSDLTYGP